jgi:hypothetical protein
MSDNGVSFNDRLVSLAADIDDQVRGLEFQREAITVELARLRRIQAALNATPAPGKARPKPRPPRRPGALSEAQTTIAQAFLDHPDDGWSAPDLVEHTGLTDPTVYNALERLRKLEFIAKAERVKSNQRNGQYRQVYRLLDAHAIEATT